MNATQILLIAALLSAGCADSRRPQPSDEMTSSFIQEFEKKYAGFRVAPELLPTPNLRIMNNLRKAPLWKNGSAEISLHLGERTRSGSGRFRTSSRYELRGSSGVLLSSAESVLDSKDLDAPDLQPSVQIAFDPASRKLLIVEEHSWSVDRIILMSLDGNQDTVRYVNIPTRESLEPFHHHEIVAFTDGKVFIKQDGAAFAFPLNALLADADLEYSIGAVIPQNDGQHGEAEPPLLAALSSTPSETNLHSAFNANPR